MCSPNSATFSALNYQSLVILFLSLFPFFMNKCSNFYYLHFEAHAVVLSLLTSLLLHQISDIRYYRQRKDSSYFSLFFFFLLSLICNFCRVLSLLRYSGFFALVSLPDNILRCRQFALPILFFQNFHIRQDMLDNARDRYSCSPASICRRHGLCLCLFYVELGYRSTLQYFSVATMKSVAGTQYFETRRNCKVVKKIFYSFAIVRA